MDQQINKLKEQLKGDTKLNSRYASKVKFSEETYNTIEEAAKEHYSKMAEVLTSELEQKMRFRKWAVIFMLAFVGLHIVVSIVVMGFVIVNRAKNGNEVVSDTFMLTFLITPLVNFLASLGIIFKYLFSQTSETYSYLKSFINHDE